MRKPQSKMLIIEKNGFYYLTRNEREQICPWNFDDKVNCGSWCPMFSIRMDEMNGSYFYYVTLSCSQLGIGFKITDDIVIKEKFKNDD